MRLAVEGLPGVQDDVLLRVQRIRVNHHERVVGRRELLRTDRDLALRPLDRQLADHLRDQAVAAGIAEQHQVVIRDVGRPTPPCRSSRGCRRASTWRTRTWSCRSAAPRSLDGRIPRLAGSAHHEEPLPERVFDRPLQAVDLCAGRTDGPPPPPTCRSSSRTPDSRLP